MESLNSRRRKVAESVEEESVPGPLDKGVFARRIARLEESMANMTEDAAVASILATFMVVGFCFYLMYHVAMQLFKSHVVWFVQMNHRLDEIHRLTVDIHKLIQTSASASTTSTTASTATQSSIGVSNGQ